MRMTSINHENERVDCKRNGFLMRIAYRNHLLKQSKNYLQQEDG